MPPAPESSKQGSHKDFLVGTHGERRTRDAEGRDDEGVEGMSNGDGVSPPQPTRGFVGASQAPPAGSGADPRRKTILLLSTRVRTPLVATCVDKKLRYGRGTARGVVSVEGK